MSTATLAYPPPLSAAPTVETLERLLSGLQRPIERNVPTPPVLVVPDRLFGEVSRPGATAATGTAPSVPLTWSAGNHRDGPSLSFATLSPATAASAVTAVAALAMVLSRG